MDGWWTREKQRKKKRKLAMISFLVLFLVVFFLLEIKQLCLQVPTYILYKLCFLKKFPHLRLQEKKETTTDLCWRGWQAVLLTML